MPHASCAHCGTEITDHTSMTERKGDLYCCANCAEIASSDGSRTAAETCGHCSTPIVDTSTEVRRGSATYCCNNCAIAAGATTPTTP